MRRLVAVVAALLLGGGLLAAPTAAAQDAGSDQQQPKPPQGEPTKLEVAKTAYYSNSTGKAAPNAVVEGFPPGVVCIVVPQSCNETTEPVTGPIRENKPDEDQAPTAPAQPFVADGTLPAARDGGQPRYVSAVKFKLPPVPEGKELQSFTLRLTQDQPTYSTDSPLFRQVVLAALVGVQTEGDPDAVRKELMRVVNNPEQYPPGDTAPMRAEVCPALTKFEAGDNQAWEKRPERGKCLTGATGTRRELDDGSVVYDFDLTLAIEDIQSGDKKNFGLYFGPVAANNTAYGDKDPTDFAQLSVAGPEADSPPVAFIKYQEKTGVGAFTLGEDGGGGSNLDAAGSGETSSGATSSGFQSSSAPASGGMSSSGSSTSGGSSAEVFSGSAPAAESGGGAPEPQAADPAGSGQNGQTQQAAQQQLAGASNPYTPWWVWLLVPIGGAGMYLVSRSLTAEAVMAVERSGAMTRLIEQRHRDARMNGPTQV